MREMEANMIKITVTELRKRFEHYVDLTQKEDIYVTRYGKELILLTKYDENKNN